MSVLVPPTPPPKTGKLVWAAVAVLCLCTLVALWVTAARVKAAKMAARYGEKIEDGPVVAPRPRLRITPGATTSLATYFASASKTDLADVDIDPACPPGVQAEVLKEAARQGVTCRFVVGEAGFARLELRRGETLRVEHFKLDLGGDGTVTVRDARDRALVEFPTPAKGAIRRWQEFQLRFGETGKESVGLEVELKPGEPCFGSGVYRALRAGLRIGLPRNASITILESDFEAARFKLRFEENSVAAERVLEPGAAGSIFSIDYRLERAPEGGLRLSLQRPD